MKDSELTALLRKFIRNRCTQRELDMVERMLQQGIAPHVWDTLLRDELTSVPDNTSFGQEQADRIYRSIQVKITNDKKQRYIQRYPMSLKWTVAAAATLLIGFFLVRFYGSPATEMKLTTTGVQEQKQLHLNDSSRVWMNGVSHIEFPETFADDKREVFLKGEAFFAVEKDAQRPFVVHTRDIAIKVIGTSFNVKSFADDDETTITLATGKIKIMDGDRELAELVPGEEFTYSGNAKTGIKRSISAADSYAWRDGILVFHKMPLSKIAASLQRTYGTHIILADSSLRSIMITLKQKNGSLRDALDVLSFTAHLKYEIHHDTVTLSKTNHQP